jgi:hypothetical protein
MSGRRRRSWPAWLGVGIVLVAAGARHRLPRSDQTKRGRERQVVFYRGEQVFFVTLNVQDANRLRAVGAGLSQLPRVMEMGG